MDIQNDNEYLRLRAAIAHAEKNVKTGLSGAQEELAKDLACMGHYLFDKEWYCPNVILYDGTEQVDSKSFYDRANDLTTWEYNNTQADPRYLHLKQQIDNSKQKTLDCTNTDYLPALKREQANSHAAMGHYFFNKNLFIEAMPFYSQAKDILPDDSTLLNQLAYCLIQLQKYSRARDILELLERRTDNKTDKALAYYNMAYIDYKIGKYNEAVKALKNTLKHHPLDEDGMTFLTKIQDLISTSALMTFQNSLFKTNRLSQPERASQKRVQQSQESDFRPQ